MAEKKLDVHLNGTNELARNKDSKPARLWRQIELNERSCSFLLLVMSLSIVLGKLYTNYGDILQLQNSSKYLISPATVFSNVSNLFDLSHISGVSELGTKQVTAVSEKFANISQYDDVVVNVMTLFCKTYGWLIRAALCGLIMMGFTWFIIYKDSSIPGINPPSPFSHSKPRYSQASGGQINYLFGVLNGILIFIYMCL
ncbi:uncharacterized protein LOC143368176 [Andrena cerasifolii]|uniref:uncharacterized protein LOC143368176 n=1 Tax=Andrena cerasifolii TaxID=2819439 RepID=UPI004037A70D